MVSRNANHASCSVSGSTITHTHTSLLLETSFEKRSADLQQVFFRVVEQRDVLPPRHVSQDSQACLSHPSDYRLRDDEGCATARTATLRTS